MDVSWEITFAFGASLFQYTSLYVVVFWIHKSNRYPLACVEGYQEAGASTPKKLLIRHLSGAWFCATVSNSSGGFRKVEGVARRCGVPVLRKNDS